MTMLNVNASTVGGRLRSARLLAGFDQAEMAIKLGVGRSTVSNWERGLFEPTVSQFIGWARETKQPVDQLIDGLPGCTPRDLNPEPTDSGCVVWDLGCDLPADEFWTRGRRSAWYAHERELILQQLSFEPRGRQGCRAL